MGKLTDTLVKMGYTFTADDEVLGTVPRLRVRSPRGQDMVLGRDEQPLLFPGDTDGIPDNDWTGADGVKTTSAEIYRDYYGMDGEAFCRFLYGATERTRAYLASRKQAIGLNSAKYAPPELFFVLDTFELGGEDGTIHAGRYADGRFVAQAAQGRDGVVLRMHFAHLPDREQVAEGALITRIERGFLLGTTRDTLDGVHWLDKPGSINEKYAHLTIVGGQAPLGK